MRVPVFLFYECEVLTENSAFLDSVDIYALIDGASTESDFIVRVERLVAAGIRLIQLRDKELSEAELVARGRALTTALAREDARWVFNDRADLAVASGADGVHLGQTDMQLSEARRQLPDSMFVGISTHQISEARAASEGGADYIGVGPVFPSRTKRFSQLPGLRLCRKVADEVDLPSFAIGGIDETNAARVVEQGLRRVAVAGALSDEERIESVVVALRSQLAQVPGCGDGARKREPL